MKPYRRAIHHLFFLTLFTLWALPAIAADKPNILVIMGDDIGSTNISAYSHGLMGYQTPNIDQIAKEGAYVYGCLRLSKAARRAVQRSSPARVPFRVGLTKVGHARAPSRVSATRIPTIAQLLKPQGYVSAQFGKNHLGDRNEYLPTVHGFDEYAGVLYHLNALEEPENMSITPRTPRSSPSSDPGTRFIPGRPTKSTRRKTRVSAWSVSKKSKVTGQVTIETHGNL